MDGAGDSRNGAKTLDELVAEFRPALHTYVSFRLDRRLRRRENVSDIVQSTVRELLAGREAFEWQGDEAFRAYVWRAAEHKLHNKRRYWETLKREGVASGAGVPEALEDDPARALTPSAWLEANEELERLAEAVDALPEPERKILTMRKFLELSPEEIAKAVELSESTVRYHLRKAMVSLSARLGGL